MAEKDTELHRITRELEVSQTKLGNAMKDVEANKEALKAYQADVEMRLEIMASKKSTETPEDRKSLTEKVQMRALITTLQGEVENSRVELTQERAKGHALEVQTRKLLDDRRAAVAEGELETQISDLREDKAGLQKDKDSYLAVVTAMREEKERLEQNQVLLMRRESMLTVRLEESQKATVKSQKYTIALDELKVKLQEATKLGSSYKARFEAAENKIVALTKMNQDLHEELQQSTDLLDKMNVAIRQHDDD
jgi:DNA repair exonuclease SbcCD ATPase subunit